jgi:hypothetical protein
LSFFFLNLVSTIRPKNMPISIAKIKSKEIIIPIITLAAPPARSPSIS